MGSVTVNVPAVLLTVPPKSKTPTTSFETLSYTTAQIAEIVAVVQVTGEVKVAVPVVE